MAFCTGSIILPDILCFISTGVTTIYGFVSKFSSIKLWKN